VTAADIASRPPLGAFAPLGAVAPLAALPVYRRGQVALGDFFTSLGVLH
jgi:hypothetical protein